MRADEDWYQVLMCAALPPLVDACQQGLALLL